MFFQYHRMITNLKRTKWEVNSFKWRKNFSNRFINKNVKAEQTEKNNQLENLFFFNELVIKKLFYSKAWSYY